MKSGPSLLMGFLGKPKGDEPDGEAEEPMGAKEDVFIDAFISAVQDDDTEGARSAFKSAVRACMKAKESGSDEYEV